MTDDKYAPTLVELSHDLIGEDPAVLQQALLGALVAARPAVVVCDQVQRVGTAALQLLVAFQIAASAREIPVELRAPSSAFREACQTLGLLGALRLPL